MKRRLSTQRTTGLTLVEVLVSIVVVALAAGVFLPMLQPARVRGCGRMNCVSNLKQVGLAMRMWSNDQGDKFPWCVSTNEGGTMEFANTPDVFVHYRSLSNELSSPTVLRCPNDGARAKASSWDQLTNDGWNVSYFIGLDADEGKPRSILSGDRNLTTNGHLAMGNVTITRFKAMGWTGRIHTNAGWNSQAGPKSSATTSRSRTNCPPPKCSRARRTSSEPRPFIGTRSPTTRATSVISLGSPRTKRVRNRFSAGIAILRPMGGRPRGWSALRPTRCWASLRCCTKTASTWAWPTEARNSFSLPRCNGSMALSLPGSPTSPSCLPFLKST